MISESMQQQVELAKSVIRTDERSDTLVLAARVVLAELERLEKGEFICRKCGLRKDGEHAYSEFKRRVERRGH